MILQDRSHARVCAVILTTLLTTPARAGTYAFQCVEPIEALVPDDEHLATEYSEEIEADFQRYFSEVTDYSACLSAAQSTAFSDARKGWEAYRAFRAQAGDPAPYISPELLPGR